MFPIIYRGIARMEFDGSIDWYEGQRHGLGDEFECEIQRAITGIASDPMRFPVVERDVRQAPVDRFPFSIYYRIRAGRIIVISVFHSARDPAEWQGRV